MGGRGVKIINSPFNTTIMTNLETFKTFLVSAAKAAIDAGAILIFGQSGNSVSTTAFPNNKARFVLLSFIGGNANKYPGKQDKTKSYIATQCTASVAPVGENGQTETPVTVPLPIDFLTFVLLADGIQSDTVFDADVVPVVGYPNIRQFSNIKVGDIPATISLAQADKLLKLGIQTPAKTGVGVPTT